MPASLDQIVAATRRRVAESKQATALPALENQAARHIPRGFKLALRAASARGPAIIAELKKASPSRGLIRADFDVSVLAPELERAGATVLSVLTDAEFFQGSLNNLRLASASCKLPCLRKDFIVDEFQLLEARANYADAILLIVASLSQPELLALARRAHALGLDLLCEAHNREELDRAIDAGCEMIGINNRDLRTSQVDIETAVRLAEFMPDHVVRVAESGIRDGADIARLRAAGYHAFLIGESLMKADSPGKALQSLLAESKIEVASGAR
jgi:indole-3-glycerol phosphate synthase